MMPLLNPLLPRNKYIIACAAILLYLTTTTADALVSDQTKPVVLDADRATYNEKTGVTTYNGNVVVVQGTIKIQADSLIANLDAKRSLINATATGNPAKFQQQIEAGKPISTGYGNTLVYDAQNGMITLTGNAYLKHNGAEFKGEQLRYSMNIGDIEANGSTSRRVHLVIPPNLTQKAKSAKTR